MAAVADAINQALNDDMSRTQLHHEDSTNDATVSMLSLVTMT
jgi:hypothetical protein